MKLKHKQKAERCVLAINDSAKKIALVRRKLDSPWTFGGKWELAKQEAEAEFERAWLELVHIIQRYKKATWLSQFEDQNGDQVFDWTVLAGLDRWLHAYHLYREVFPNYEMGSTNPDQDIYGGERPGKFD